MKIRCLRTALAATFITTFSLLGSGSVTAAPENAFPVKTLQQMVASSDVRIIKTVEQLPPDVRARFRERVRSIGESESAKPHLIDMANPGKSWNAGCVQMPGLPGRQLQFAGVAKRTCFVVFNTGGIRSAQMVAVFDLSKNPPRVLGVALATARCNDLEGLRKMVKSKVFPKYPNSTSL